MKIDFHAPVVPPGAWGTAREKLRTARGLGLLAVLACGLSVGIALRASTFDDPWITYRVAENLAAGNGFVYNLGERFLVTTTPLYTLILAGFALIGFPVPEVSTVFSILGLASGGGLIYLLLASRLPLGTAIVAGLFYVLFPLMPTAFGMETNFYMALALGAVYLYMSGRTVWAAVLLALATLTRMDAIILAVALLVYQLLNGRRFPYRETLVYLGLCAPWFVFSQVYFGSLVPGTLGAKVAQLSLGWFSTFLPGAAEYFRWALEPSLIRFYLLALLFLGLWQSIRRYRFALPIVGWGLLYAFSYEGLRVPFYHWYLAPAMPALVLALALGLTLPLEWSRAHRQFTSALVVGLLGAPLLVNGLARDAELLQSGPDERVALYREVGEWLKDNARSDAQVEATEIGVIGYYAGRPMVDFAGLTHPQVARRLQQQDLDWSIFHFWPEYVVLLDDNPFDRYLQSQDRFKGFYTRAKQFTNPSSSIIKSVSVFRLWSEESKGDLAVKAVGNRFGDIQVLKVEAERLTAKAGEEVRLGLYWRPLAPLDRDYSTFVHLVDADWKTHAQSDNPRSTTQWEVGKTYGDYHLLKIPPGIPDGAYWLNIGVYQARPFQNLKTVGEDGQDTTSLRVFQIQVSEWTGAAGRVIPGSGQ